MTSTEVSALDTDRKAAIDCLLGHIRKCDGWAYDPYDARIGKPYQYMGKVQGTLWGKLFRAMVYGVETLSPIAFRKLRGIQPNWDPMGNSYFAGALMALYLVDHDQAKLDEARRTLDRILTKAVGTPGKRGFALGFPCITGSYKLWSTEVPVAHYTLRTARKLMMWERIVGDGRYLPMLEENMRFFTEVLEWVEVDGMTGVAYTPDDPMQVVNIWTDVASTLACYGAMKGDHPFKDKALALTESILGHFRPDDTWPYHAKWTTRPYVVDNSHTGMVVGGLADIALCYPDDPIADRIRAVLERAVTKWLDLFFDPETGAHWNLLESKHQCATVAWPDALYAFHRLLRPELGLSQPLCDRMRDLQNKVDRWSMKNLRLANGRYCVFKYPLRKYAVGGIRSFDGLIADALAISYATPRVSRDDSSKLWTI